MLRLLLTPDHRAVQDVYTETEVQLPWVSKGQEPVEVILLRKIVRPSGQEIWEVEPDTSTWTIKLALGSLQNPIAESTLAVSAPTLLTVTDLTVGGVGVNHTSRVELHESVYGGGFTVTVNGGEETAQIPYGSTAAEFQTILEATAYLAPGDVVVRDEAGGKYHVTFQGTKAATNPSFFAGQTGELLALIGFEGTLDTRTAEVDTLISGVESAETYIEVEAAVPSKGVRKLLKAPITFYAPVIPVATPP